MFQELPERRTRQTTRRDNREGERERERARSGQDTREEEEASGSRVTVCFTSFFFFLFFFCIFSDQFHVVTNYQLLARVVFALPRRVPARVQKIKSCACPRVCVIGAAGARCLAWRKDGIEGDADWIGVACVRA